MLRHDYIGRLIQQIAEFLARAARRLGEAKAEQAEAELSAAERALGIPLGAERLDARSVALLLGGKDKVVMAALIAEQRAALSQHRGQAELARAQRARALGLLANAEPFELTAQAAELRERLSR